MDADGEGPIARDEEKDAFSRCFSENLRRLREEADLSQEELAFRSAIHRSQISVFESGTRLPRADTLVRLAGAVGATPNDLLSGLVWEPLISTVTGGLKAVAPREATGNG